MTHKHILHNITLFVIFLLCSPLHADKPNIIFVLTDDQRHDAMGFVGKFPWLETPNIDRIAGEGVQFTNAFVTTSLCSPSRASFLTGCYANRHGVIVNSTMDPDPGLVTFPRALQDVGYETAFIGKWHMAPGHHKRSDYTHWVSFDGQGNYYGNEININDELVYREEYITDVLTEYSLEFIERERSHPFMLYLSHKAVHSNFTPPKRHANYLADVEMPSLDNENDVIEDKPGWLKKTAYRKRGDRKVMPPWPSTRNYFKTIKAVDEGLGKILAQLEKQEILDDTVIIFAGDNGYFLQEHGGLADKRRAYEPSMRIPLIMRYPKLVKANTKCDEFVLNIDLAPTIMRLAGVEVPSTVQGKSWLEVLDGSEKGHERFFYEYYNEIKYRDTNKRGFVPTSVGIRTKNWKFVTFPDLKNEINELYDLDNDPEELRNLIAKPEYAKKVEAMKNALAAIKSEIGYKAPEQRKRKAGER